MKKSNTLYKVYTKYKSYYRTADNLSLKFFGAKHRNAESRLQKEKN